MLFRSHGILEQIFTDAGLRSPPPPPPPPTPSDTQIELASRVTEGAALTGREFELFKRKSIPSPDTFIYKLLHGELVARQDIVPSQDNQDQNVIPNQGSNLGRGGPHLSEQEMRSLLFSDSHPEFTQTATMTTTGTPTSTPTRVIRLPRPNLAEAHSPKVWEAKREFNFSDLKKAFDYLRAKNITSGHVTVDVNDLN